MSHHIPETFGDVHVVRALDVHLLREMNINLEVRRGIRKFGAPVPCQEILPLICRMWNKRKIAIDSMSREIRALSLQTPHGGTHGNIILEMLEKKEGIIIYLLS